MIWRRTCSLWAGILLITAADLASAPINDDSPFGPNRPPAPGANTAGKWELVGLTLIDGQPQACLWDTGKKLHTWLSIGGKVDELTLLRCDPSGNFVVVRLTAGEQTLTLRKSKGPTIGTPSPLPTASPSPSPIVTAAPTDPTATLTKEEQAEEARNFIGDWMDISQRQRAAYEQAQRAAEKAARAKRANPPPPADAPPATQPSAN